MLSPQKAEKILSTHGQGAPWTRHCLAVAEAAVGVGRILGRRRAIDAAFLWTAALLHDIGRHATHDPVGHGVAGYNLLSALGHPREAHVCASHILFGLNAHEAARFGLPARDFLPGSIEAQLVALVDLLVEFDRPTTLAQRFASLRRRNADNPFFLARLDRAFACAQSFMTQIEQEIGESPERIVAAQDQRS
jgi:putative nucleotidyltransferase with HDIG domain